MISPNPIRNYKSYYSVNYANISTPVFLTKEKLDQAIKLYRHA